MPRGPREKSETGLYHIMLRGIDKREIFLSKSDYKRFLSYIEKIKETIPVSVYAYCLMTNHVHILIKSETEEIGNIVRRIAVGYAQYHNIKYGRTGHLFQNRFRSETVNDDNYFLIVLRYIHQNPINAGIVKNVSDYQWSSYHEYIGYQSKLIDKSFALQYFSNINKFIEFMNQTNKDKCLEYQQNTRYTDKDLGKIISLSYDLDSIKHMDIKARNNVILKIKGDTGVSNRQLARVLNIGRSIIERV